MNEALAPPPEDPARFSAERFRANLAALVELGARAPGDEASELARAWAQANAPRPRADAVVALVAPLAANGGSSDALAEASSGAALIVEAARALGAQGAAPRIDLFDSVAPAPPALSGVAVAVYVPRACALPAQRDLLSHRVLRERFFDLAGAEAGAAGFAQSDAPHAALLAAGARRLVVLDAPRTAGAECESQKFGDALVRFVRDASALLTRGSARGVNAAPAQASQPMDGASALQEKS